MVLPTERDGDCGLINPPLDVTALLVGNGPVDKGDSFLGDAGFSGKKRPSMNMRGSE